MLLYHRFPEAAADQALSGMCLDVLDVPMPRSLADTLTTFQTCKNLFHSSCLFKWFKTSNASTCPLCRNAFNFN